NSCPGLSSSAGSGKDIVYAFSPPASGTYDIQVKGLWDRVVYVATNCADVNTSCVAGHDAATIAGTEQILLNATAGTTYYIVVDGWSSSSEGPYEITIVQPPCTPGTGGMIGTSVSTLATDIPSFGESYLK